MKTGLAIAIGWASVALAAAPNPNPPLSHDEIKRAVDSHLAEVKACMKQHGSATGKLVVKFAILPTGKTTDAAPEHASSNAALDKCIAALFLKWEFPKPRGGVNMGVVYPFVFSKPAKPATLDDKQVLETIRAHQPDVKACYDLALKQKPDLAGKLEVTFSVGPSGQVVASKIDDASKLKFPPLDSCIVAKTRTWQFPKPSGDGTFDFTFPFELAPEKRAAPAKPEGEASE